MLGTEVSQVQFQELMEVPEEKAMDDPLLLLGQTFQKHIEVLPGMFAVSVALGAFCLQVGGSKELVVLDLPSQVSGFDF